VDTVERHGPQTDGTAVLVRKRSQTPSQNSPQKIEMYAQDPWFGEGEEQFLCQLGFEILHLGEAEELTGPDTFVYAPKTVFVSIWNTMSRQR
jgi:hypothetical protein